MKLALVLMSISIAGACRKPPPVKPTNDPDPRHPTAGSDAPVDAGGAVVTTQPSSNATVKQFPARPLIESPHAGPIKMIAVTSDGGSAITVDDIDGLRLWPKLDGTVEPRVVELVRPKVLALGRDGDGFLAVVVDDVGGLVLATLDANGITKQRATIAPDPGFVGAIIVGGNVLAWRADQMLFLIDKNGVALAQLATEPGERIATMVTANDLVVAIVETASDEKVRRRPRPLTVNNKAGSPTTLVWGSRIEIDGDLGTMVAMSPSGKRVGALLLDSGKTSSRIVVWDLSTKKATAQQLIRFATNIAFLDEDHVALIQPNAVEWADLATAKPPDPAMTFEPFVTPLRAPYGVGGGRLVAPRNDELALITPSETKYLGYGLESPQVAAVGQSGQLLVGLGENFALLDRDLRETSAPKTLVPKQSTITELEWLSGSSWLVETSGLSDGKTAIAIVDVVKDTRKELRSNLPVAQLMMYEPETKLVTFSLGDAPEVAKYNADKVTLDKQIVLAKPNGFEQRELIPIAPSLAGGAQLLSVQMRDRTTIRWVNSVAAVDSGPSVVIDGSLAGSDRAGHVYVWQNGADHKLALAVFDKGKQIGTLPTEGTTTVWPDAKGQRVVLLTARDISLLTLDGKKVWSLALQGATEAQWLDDGTIALVSAGGVARIDPAKGEITATRCGWRFGLSATPHPFTSRIEPVCVQQH